LLTEVDPIRRVDVITLKSRESEKCRFCDVHGFVFVRVKKKRFIASPDAGVESH
jgi:hypothetical protein